jgi:hypothetical protein
MDVLQYAAHLDSAELQCLIQALENGASLLQVGDELYACSDWESCYQVWKLKPGSTVYRVDKALTYCSCPIEGKCKHLIAFSQAATSAKVQARHNRRGKRRERGES